MRKIVKLFQPRFATMVRDGSKLNTIRPLPKRPRDVPQVGWEISLREWTGKPYRSKQRVLKESAVVRVASVRIEEVGVYIDSVWTFGDTVAKEDGFQDFIEMAEWFKKTHGLPFNGAFIAWKP